MQADSTQLAGPIFQLAELVEVRPRANLKKGLTIILEYLKNSIKQLKIFESGLKFQEIRQRQSDIRFVSDFTQLSREQERNAKREKKYSPESNHSTSHRTKMFSLCCSNPPSSWRNRAFCYPSIPL